MRVLRAQHPGKGGIELVGAGDAVEGGLLPEEVAELLGRVGVAAGAGEQLLEGLGADLLVRPEEALADEAGEALGIDELELDLLRAVPEGLVDVVEEALHHVAAAAEVDVGDLGLLLEHRPQQLRQPWVERLHLLELVEDQRHPPALAGPELGRELQQALERRLEVGRRVVDSEGEVVGAALRVDRDPGGDPQVAERGQRPLLDARSGGRDVLVDRGGELLRQLRLRRRGHQVDVGDEHVVADELLHRFPHQRRLPVAPGGEDDHVLAVEHVELELLDLRLAVRERLVEGEPAEAEGVRGRFAGLRHNGQ